jgi:TolB-like protein/DNA-binding winged helix-turn-helix (wHTH) protein/Tfp pilus assembly protein PilF
MEERMRSAQVVRFGVFEVDLRAHELRKHGLRVRLQEQPFQILMMLLDRRGEVVTRDELRSKLWPTDVFVDFDQGLNNAIKKLRVALSESAENPRFVETLPRHGYRFIATLNTPPDAAGFGNFDVGIEPRAPSTETDTTAGEQPPQAQARTAGLSGSRGRYAMIGTVALAVIFALAAVLDIGGVRDRLSTKPWPARIQSMAVLPLKNLSNDPEQDYFADGITDALITELGKISALRVISRTSIVRYKDTTKPLADVARELRVDAIVEGTVVRSGARVRITANLVQASPEKHLWAEAYERELSDVLVLQRELARAITGEIRIRVTSQEQARLAVAHSVDPEAYQLYLKGRYLWNRRTGSGLRRAIDYYQQAIEKDPGFAFAYAGVAESLPVLSHYGYLSNKEAVARTRAAATKALEIDETVAQAHSALATIKMTSDWDWSGAETEYKRALDLNPGDATAHSWYAQYLVAGGRSQEALDESRRAAELDPFSLIINSGWGRRLYLTRRYDEAIRQCQRALELDPNFAATRWCLGDALRQEGQLPQAIRELQKAVDLSDGSPMMAGSLAYALGVSGRRSEAQAVITTLVHPSKSEHVDPYAVAVAYVGLGEKEKAFKWLEAAYEERDSWLIFLGVDPRLDRLRSDPRFAELVRRLGLPS